MILVDTSVWIDHFRRGSPTLASLLEEASVVSVTRGPDVRQSIPNATSNGDNNRSVSNQTVYVNVR